MLVRFIDISENGTHYVYVNPDDIIAIIEVGDNMNEMIVREMRSLHVFTDEVQKIFPDFRKTPNA